jgi:hypothetical protein
MFSISNTTDAKAAAKRLRNRLAREGINISNSLALETVSAMMNHKNWNVSAALLDQPVRMASPFLGVQPWENASYHVVEYTGEQPRVPEDLIKLMSNGPVVLEGRPAPGRLALTKVGSKDDIQNLFHVPDIRSAERLALTLCDRRFSAVFDPTKVMVTELGNEDRWVALFIMINRQANTIAACTRRGAGNVVLVSNKLYETKLKPCIENSTLGIWDRNDPVHVQEGDYTMYCTINGSLKLYGSDHIPENRVYVAYKGGEDDAGAYVYADGETLYMHTPIRGLCNLDNFIRAIHIK